MPRLVVFTRLSMRHDVTWRLSRHIVTGFVRRFTNVKDIEIVIAQRIAMYEKAHIWNIGQFDVKVVDLDQRKTIVEFQVGRPALCNF